MRSEEGRQPDARDRSRQINAIRELTIDRIYMNSVSIMTEIYIPQKQLPRLESLVVPGKVLLRLAR